jgi:hypothetical protein
MSIRAPSVRFAAVLGVALLQAGCGSRAPSSLDVGADARDGSSESFDPLDAGGSGVLDAHIEQKGVSITFVTVSCAGPCADVKAVATGGTPPYTFAWEDGSTNAQRRVCPTSSSNYHVTVRDTGIAGEFPRAPQSVDVPLTAKVLACPDGGGAPACDGGGASTVAAQPETLAIDTTGSVRYFAGGAALPAGRYRVEYVDGCMMYGANIANATQWGWTIHTGALAINPALSGMPYSGECVLVGADSSTVVDTLPGTTNPPPGFATYSACVAANVAMDAPLDFDFGGGKLGLFVEDLLPGDDVGGEGSGGVSPTWKLTPLSVCP